MDKDLIKSCKYCLALSAGIILGMIIMNSIKDPIIKFKNEDNKECSCSN